MVWYLQRRYYGDLCPPCRLFNIDLNDKLIRTYQQFQSKFLPNLTSCCSLKVNKFLPKFNRSYDLQLISQAIKREMLILSQQQSSFKHNTQPQKLAQSEDDMANQEFQKFTRSELHRKAQEKQLSQFVSGISMVDIENSNDYGNDAPGAAGKKKNIISLKDKIVLGPIDRYKKYNHFPWKFIVHILLIAVTSMQVITIVGVQTDFAYNSQLLYLNKFMTTSWNGETVDDGQTITIYDITSLTTFVKDVNDNFMSIGSVKNFEKIELPESPNNQIEMVTIPIDSSQPPVRSYLTAESLGPLGNSNAEIKQWLRQTEYFTLGWSYNVHYPDTLQISDDCYHWRFLQKFQFKNRGTIKVTFKMYRNVCEDTIEINSDEYSLVWISFIAMGLSVFNFILICLYFYGMGQHLQKMQRIFDKRINAMQDEQESGKRKKDHETQLIEEYRKTEIKNKRFQMRQSGIDFSVNLNQTRTTRGMSVQDEIGQPGQVDSQPQELSIVDSNPDISQYRRSGAQDDNADNSIVPLQVVEEDDELSTLSDRSDLSERQLNALREKKGNKIVTWESLSVWDKAALFNKWSVLQGFGNLFTTFGSLFYILSPYFSMPQVELFIGLGCAINWMSVARYFVLSRTYSLITRTLQVAVPMNIKIMAGIAPIFIGYCLLALSIFWNDREFFSEFSDTAYTFFSMMNGDSILVTFAYTTRKNPLLGQFMCYSFVFMAICVWQNMNLVIVEDSYLNVKYKTGYSWLMDNGDDDEQPPPNQKTDQPQGQALQASVQFGSGGGPAPSQGPFYPGSDYQQPMSLGYSVDPAIGLPIFSPQLSPPFSPQLQDMTLEIAQYQAPDKDDGQGSQKSNDSMAAQQHVENREVFVQPFPLALASPMNLQPPSQEHIDQQLQGMAGHKKTNALVSELKKHYKLNKLKSFLDYDANNAKGIQQQQLQLSLTSNQDQSALRNSAFNNNLNNKAPSEDKALTVVQSDNQTIMQQRVAQGFKNFQRDIVDQAQLSKFKDFEKNKQLKLLYEQFAKMMTNQVGYESLERLRKKVTHDIEHQIEDLIKLRDFVSKNANIECSKIEVPQLSQ